MEPCQSFTTRTTNYYNNFGDFSHLDDEFAEPEFPYDHRESGQEDNDDGKFDEVHGIPFRLKRLFKVYDVLKDHNLSALRWDVVGLHVHGNGPGIQGRSMPPPPEDPRTQLPEIFGFRGWNLYKCPDFYIRDDHLPCYPQELVGRLKALHESGAGGRKVVGVLYLLMKDYDEEGSSEQSDNGSENDSEESSETRPEDVDGSESKSSSHFHNEDEMDRPARCIGNYETLELANDAAMTHLEQDFRDSLMFQESSDDQGTPDFNCGLHLIVPQGQEKRLPYDGEEGVTWALDGFGCLKFTGYGDVNKTFTVIRQESTAVSDGETSTSELCQSSQSPETAHASQKLKTPELLRSTRRPEKVISTATVNKEVISCAKADEADTTHHAAGSFKPPTSMNSRTVNGATKRKETSEHQGERDGKRPRHQQDGL